MAFNTMKNNSTKNNSTKNNSNMLKKNNRFDVLKETSERRSNTRNQNKTKNPKRNHYQKGGNHYQKGGNHYQKGGTHTKRGNHYQKNCNDNNVSFSNNYELFPELSTRDIPTNETNPTHMNYAEVTKPVKCTIENNEVQEGWVKISLTDNKIVYSKNKNDVKREIDSQNIQNPLINGLDNDQQTQLQDMVMRWETFRNNENEMYEEMSRFWHEKSLLDPLSDDCYSESSDVDESSDEDMDEDLDEYYDEI